uniref:IPD083Fh n=1 Tax=Asplenium scolopendrium TaxID=41964 RepID=A0A3S6ZSK9_9MONI|nr:IPD083Fh [Asplenium scolopendrium]
MEYSDLYEDVNQVSLRFQQTEFSEVMVVHRMYFRLLDLDMSTGPSFLMFPGSEKVRRLYIVADIVELPANGINMRLPATVSVVILCRVLYVQDVNSPFLTCGLHFPLMRMRVVETQEGTVRVFPVPDSSSSSGGSTDIGLFIHADRFIYRQDTSTLDPLQPLQLRVIGGSTFSTVRPGWPETLEVFSLILWLTLSKGQPIPATESDLQRSDEVELLPPPSPDRLLVVFTGLAPGNIGSMSVDVEYIGAGFSYFSIPPVDPVPTEVLSDPYIILGLQMNMLIAELVLAAHNSPRVINVVTKHVEWLNKILRPKLDLPNDDILGLLFRVQTFLKMAKQPRSVVPRLQYHMYSSLINRMVQVAQVYDQDFKQLKLFIAQNQILGSYLLEQNKAFASKEKDMSSFHSQVVSLRRTELNNAIDKMDQLSVQMENENQAMDQAKEDMMQAIEEYEKKQLANALFAVLGAIASVALAFATAGATAPAAVAAAGAAVSAAGRLAEGLKKVVEILEGLAAVMEIVAVIRELVESLQNLGSLIDTPDMPDMPSDADWLIFVNEVEAVAEQMPADVVGSVAVWKAKCKNVAVLGQEMCTTAAHIGELTYQIKVEEMLQEIAQKQANRLEGITPADLSSYTEMLSQIDMRTTRQLLQLIRVLNIQNAAIKYEYLYVASRQLDSWPVSMDTVWSMLLQQETSAITGLLDLGPSTDFTRTFVVKNIPVGLLVDGRDWQFVIPVEDSPTFPIGYSRVRIRYVELKFEQDSNDGSVIHQPRTNSGLIYMLLQNSQLFSDRRRREILDYEASMGLAYAFAYNLTTGVPTLTNIPSDEHANTFMRMTPFNNWRLRLSSSAEENRGLAFPTANSLDDITQVSITFYITAIRGIDTRREVDEE